MTKRVYIDFESRSQADIYTTGAWVYSEHPSTEILCLAYAIDQGPVMCTNFHGTKASFAQVREFFNNLVAEGAEFHAHNAFFERSMWANILSPKFGFNPIPLRQWRCTAAKASAHALPKSLEKAADALELKNRKDVAGSVLMKKLAKSTGPISIEDMARLMIYCRQDVEVEREMDARLKDLEPREQNVWFLDQQINDVGVTVDIEACQRAVECLDIETERLTKELNTISGGEISAGTQRDAVKKFLEKKGVKLANLQKKTVETALATAEGSVSRVLVLRQLLNLTSNAKYRAFLECTSKDARVRDILVYHGASTGRWAGKLVQLQNLVKPKEQDYDNRGDIGILKSGGHAAMSLFHGDNTLNVLSSCIRGMLIPTDGHEMFTTDFASIEARVVMWLAGEEKGLELFDAEDNDKTHPGIYVYMARQIYQDQSLLKKDKAKRQTGKQTVLGCGFGMGVYKFYETCVKYGVDLGPATVEVEVWGEKRMVPQLAIDAVQGYRKTFPKVPQFWYAVEEAAKAAVRGKPTQIGKVVWFMDGEFLRCRLPFGRTLAYHRPRIEGDKLTFMAADPKTKRYVPEETWGGTLVENITQAVARDLMVESMFQFSTTGFRTLFTVHDELVLEALSGTKTEADVLKIVRTVPSWAQGCPVNAECEKVDRYKK